MIKYGKDYFKRDCEDCYSCCLKLLSYLGIGGHGDRLTKLFGGQKRCCDGQWPLTVSYFKHCPNHTICYWDFWISSNKTKCVFIYICIPLKIASLSLREIYFKKATGISFVSISNDLNLESIGYFKRKNLL